MYVRELAAALVERHPGDRWHLLASCPRELRLVDPDVPPGAKLHTLRVPRVLQDALARFGWGLESRTGGADVLHWTDYVVPPPTRAPLVATIHDVLFETLPECYTPRTRVGCRRATTRLVRQAARIIVPATRARDDLVALYDVDASKIDVVPHGFRRLPGTEPARDLGPYVLFAATLEPRKNVLRLLEAWRRIDTDARLHLVGSRGWKDQPILEALERTPRATWEGHVGRERLSALYRGALALAYPSLGEGFGLPVLEAMSVGCPVLVGRDTTCEDVAGDGGLAVDPRDVDAMAHGLDRLIRDEGLRARLGGRGRARAATHTWARAADATREVYAKALQS